MRQYSVQALVTELDQLVQDRYPRLLVEGEVAQLTVAGSGHAYLTLREPGASRAAATVSAVCWRSTWQALSTPPKAGDRVVCRGKLSVYGQRGQVQLTVHEIRPAGEGALAKQIAERIARLTADGLLDPARKRPLPRFPRVIGVVASVSGAAVQDFLRVSRERHPAARILVAPALTQGAEAASSVVRGIDLLLEDGRAEVIVVTRGGGSKEDLLAFQDEQLARYVANCPVPVVSAVGHEIDTTLIDLVADVAVPTPTAAAIAVLPDGQALSRTVDDARADLDAAMGRRLARDRQQLVALKARLRHPGDRLREVRRRRGELDERLRAAMSRRLSDQRDRVARGQDGLHRGVRAGLDAARARVGEQSAALAALSPLAVLSRGYAVVRAGEGVVSDAASVRVGDVVTVRVQRGEFTATVQSSDAEEGS